MIPSQLHHLRSTVDFAKARGWIKSPPPRKPGEPCVSKYGRHHFKAGICMFCGDLKQEKQKAA